MKRRPTGHGKRGFTLIEALAAMLLLAIVLPVAMRGISNSLMMARNAKRSAEAATLAQSKLNELVATNDFGGSQNSGDFGTDFPGYRWTAQTTSGDLNVSQVTVSVTWDAGGRPQSLSVSTLVADTASGSIGGLGF